VQDSALSIPLSIIPSMYDWGVAGTAHLWGIVTPAIITIDNFFR